MAIKKSTLIIDGQNRGALNALNQTTTRLGGAVNQVRTMGTGLTGALSGFTGLLTNIPFMMTAAATGMVAGFASMIKSSIDTADNFAKMSQRIGASVEFLSTMKYALDLGGSSLETFEKALGRLSRTLDDAANGLTTATRPFNQLGISVTDASGNLRNVEEIIYDVADSFASMGDGSQKTAYAMQLFGRSGAELIPILNEGKEGLKEMQEEAKKIGLEISTNTAKQAEVFNDNLELLKLSLQGAANVAAEQLLPSLVSLTSGLADVATNTNTVSVLSEGLVTILKVLGTAFIAIGAIIYQAGQFLGTFGATAAKLLTLDFKGMSNVWSLGWEKIAEFEDATFSLLDAIWGKTVDYDKALKQIQDQQALEIQRDQAEKLAKEWENVNKQINKDLIKTTYGELAAQVTEIDQKYSEYMSKFPGYIELLTKWRDALKQAAIDASLPLIELPEELPFPELDILPDDRARYSEWSDFRIAEEARVSNAFLIEQALRSSAVSDTFDNMAGAAHNFYQLSGQQNKAAFALYKGFAIAQAGIATYQAAIEAYKSLVGIPIIGPGLAVAAAAAATAFGLSNIARIASMQPGNSAGGGVGGGGGSIPSISNTQTNNSNNRQISYVINFYGSGFDQDKDKFARDIISSLNKAQEDGLIINRV